MILGFAAAFLGGLLGWWFLAIALGSYLMIMIPFRVLSPRILGRKLVGATPLLHGHTTVTATADHLRIETEHYRAEIEWPAFVNCLTTDRLVLLYESPWGFHTIPRHFFATEEDWQAFRTLVRRHVGSCAKCGYSLRGSESDDCPECGDAIA